MLRYEGLEYRLRERNMNRTGLAKVLGISSRTIAKIGRGEKLSPIVLGRISAYLNCRPEELYVELPENSGFSAASVRETSAQESAAIPDADRAQRPQTVYETDNAMYIIDRNYRLVNFNEQMKRWYPDIRVGDQCYSAILNRPEPCESCPLHIENSEDLIFLNPVLKRWVSIRRTQIDYPGAGPCTVLTCRNNSDVRHSIRNRLPAMSGYDVFIEMNLTRNNYRIILPDDPAQEKAFSKDRLDDLILRTANTLVHPDDRDAFLEFWDINTLLERISGPEHEIHGVFRECRKSGVWDTIYITIVPEEYYGAEDVMITALYMIVPGYATDGAAEGTESDVYVGEHKVNYDYMTGLPLRRSFWDIIEHRMMEKENQAKTFFVLAMDIANFHVINNWYGRAAGDSLLAKLGAFLRTCDTERQTLSAYMGGDNFCTVFPQDRGLLEEIVSGVSEIVKSFGDNAGFYSMFGACRTDLRSPNAPDAYDLCVMTMKRDGTREPNTVSWYDDRMIEEQAAEEQLLFRFQEGMERGEITFHLQPKCDIRTGRIVGAEALARWNSGELGQISPAVFIPVLEKAGKVSRLDYFIWESVCRTIADWRSAGLPVLPVSVNVSRIDVFSMDIVHTFTSLVERYGLRTSDIEIEITESAYVENDTIIREILDGLRTAGFSTLIDDFGSGYSSLNFLKDIDADAIKLDLRFLDMSESNYEKGSNIVSSMLSMAERLNMVTIAEGVENEEQVRFLQYGGCPLAQGYYYYKPMPPADFEALIRDPEKIAEGLHLSNFMPKPRQEQNDDIRSFDGFDEKLEDFMRTLMDVASLVRIVDVRDSREYRLGAGSRLVKQTGHCYDIWGRKRECSDCISVTAVENRRTVSKYESLGRERYYVIAKPILIGGEIMAIETAIRVDG